MTDRDLQAVVLPAEAFATGESIAAFFDANPTYSRADFCDHADERWGGTAKAFVQFPAVDIDPEDATGGECRDLPGGAKGLYFRRKAIATPAESATGTETTTDATGAGDDSATIDESKPKGYGYSSKHPHGAQCCMKMIEMAHEVHRTIDHPEVKSLFQEAGRKAMSCLKKCYPTAKMSPMYDGDEPDFGEEPAPVATPKAADATTKSIAVNKPAAEVPPAVIAELRGVIGGMSKAIYRLTGQEV